MPRQRHRNPRARKRIHHGQNLTTGHSEGVPTSGLMEPTRQMIGGAVCCLLGVAHGARSSVVLRHVVAEAQANRKPVSCRAGAFGLDFRPRHS